MYEYSNISTHIIILSHNVCDCITTRIIISIYVNIRILNE